ncbi:MAG: hypothetical protein EOP48_34700 [Sphingobacteriales bacterium]|nr:MAG: hypothetical protein EOP48_34700 [Sphingobacteriales bacterium]
MISRPIKTPPSTFDRLELLKTGDNIARFNNCLLKKGHGLFKRGQLLKIINLVNKQSVVCYARGQSQDLFIGKKTIALEYDATVVLEVDMRSFVNLQVTPASFWDIALWQWSHPDRGIRIAIRVSFIGFLVDLLGLIVNFIQFSI